MNSNIPRVDVTEIVFNTLHIHPPDLWISLTGRRASLMPEPAYMERYSKPSKWLEDHRRDFSGKFLSAFGYKDIEERITTAINYKKIQTTAEALERIYGYRPMPSALYPFCYKRAVSDPNKEGYWEDRNLI